MNTAMQDNVDNKQKWYILRVSSGFEKNVCESLKSNPVFEEIYSPIEFVKTISERKVVEKETSLIKGYIWVKCIINDEVLDFIQKTRYVVGFLGGGQDPKFTGEREMEIFKNTSSKVAAEVKNIFVTGEFIRVSEGPFKSFSGIIDSIDNDKCSAVISLRILGKETKVNVNLSEIKKDDSES